MFGESMAVFQSAMAQIAEENAPKPHTVTFDEGLPAGEKLVELWLPNVGGVAISALQIEGGATCCIAPDERLVRPYVKNPYLSLSPSVTMIHGAACNPVPLSALAVLRLLDHPFDGAGRLGLLLLALPLLAGHLRPQGGRAPCVLLLALRLACPPTTCLTSKLVSAWG